ncbi:MAG: YitT family protein [Tissierellia bacterium]|nr:YitT family protein [Tissierellia bacterium]MDD4781211.1 YitT family protein [Tissierellia bacterium]
MSIKKTIKNFTNKKLYILESMITILLGTAIISFGIYNIHQQTDITEGGIIGLILLLNHWTGASASILSPILDILAYGITFRYLGKDFLKTSFVATLSLAGFFKLWEQFPPILPDLSSYPFIAAIIGGIFIGTGTGLIIKQGGSAGGDDALALTISELTNCRISYSYLATDLTVLLLSLTYLPLRRIAFSLITVTVSSLIIEFMQSIERRQPEDNSNEINDYCI